ncbi:MAG: DUF4388 domain-containing protein [Planctomycetota bacterium]|nr:DUF4388 domain-containing protein [Planctomycetota bacterium]
MDLQGPLDLFGLEPLLRVAEHSQSSFGITVEHPIAKGEVFVSFGFITWARVGRSLGKEALLTLASWTGAKFRLTPGAPTTKNREPMSPRAVFERDLRDSEPLHEVALQYVPIQGELSAIDIRQILHIFWLGGGAAKMHVSNVSEEGEIELEAGLIGTARVGSLEGREAVEHILGMEGCSVEILPGGMPIEQDDSLPIHLFLDLPEEAEEEVEITEVEDLEFEDAPLVEQIKKAKKGNVRERVLAACSSRDEVAISVVQEGNVTTDLAETLASKALTNSVVLKYLGEDKMFGGRPSVARALVFNPSTPPGTAADLLDRLRDADVRRVVRDSGAHSEFLRTRAKKLLDIRKKKRKL